MDYKERIEAAKEQLKAADAVEYKLPDSAHAIRTAVYAIYPELRESEDEKVRKALIEMVHDTTGDELWIDYNVHKEDALAWLEKQGGCSIKWNKNTKDNKPQINHSVLMLTKSGISEGEWIGGNQWSQYRWSGIVRDSDVIGWMELSALKKQGEQKPAWSEEDEVKLQACIDCLQAESLMGKVDTAMTNWLKSLKQKIKGE